MKAPTSYLLLTAALLSGGCGQQQNTASVASVSSEASAPTAGQSAVADDESQKDVVKVAVGSPAHTTLVTAVKAADLVDVLSNAGPFTVFAPTNDAFAKLPAGTVETLLKPENKDKLADILQYHVAVAVYREDMLTDGRVINMANGGDIRISRKDGKVVVNDSATLVGTVPASNGIIHVLDGVLLQPATK
jgi:uncharacterized surface protein with fasciclin (FAS1) repeats